MQTSTAIATQKPTAIAAAGTMVASAGGRPEQFREAIRNAIEVWRKVVSEAGVKAE
jgi:hypothetical protein